MLLLRVLNLLHHDLGLPMQLPLTLRLALRLRRLQRRLHVIWVLKILHEEASGTRVARSRGVDKLHRQCRNGPSLARPSRRPQAPRPEGEHDEQVRVLGGDHLEGFFGIEKARKTAVPWGAQEAN